MSTYGGQRSILVTSANIYAVNLSNCILLDSGDKGIFGGYMVKVYHNTSGCGNPSSYIFLELNDSHPWTGIACEFELGGTASCWNFNYNGDGYLLNYSENDGDIIPNERCLNCWEYAEFRTHSKVTACDNDSNNFFHGGYQKGDPKIFLMKRRRDGSGNKAGIYHYRSCNSTGASSYTIIKNIRIW